MWWKMPQRLLETARQVPVSPEAGVATFTAVFAAAVATVVSGVNLFLGGALITAMLLNQLSGLLKAAAISPTGVDWYDSTKFWQGFARRALIVIGVLGAGLLDMVSLHIPAWGDLAAELTPLTKGALAYGIIGQLVSMYQNVAVVKEAQLMAAFMTRRVDAARLGYEPPERRHYDAHALQVEESLRTAAERRPFREVAREKDHQTRGEG